MKYRGNYILILVFLFFYNFTNSQSLPFNCDSNAYLFQNNDVYSIDLASGTSALEATDVTPGNINAVGYNSKDGYIWGSLSTPEKTIVKIGKDYQTTTYYFSELPTANRYVGDVGVDGIYYVKTGGNTYAKIDLDPNSGTYLTYLSTETLSQSLTIHDWAFNSVDNHLYAAEKSTNKLYRINVSTNAVEDLGEIPILSGNTYTYGAVYFDYDGNFYISSNQTGTIYRVKNVASLSLGSNMDSNIFAFGPSSSSNDGARCPTASVPEEDCNNGIDDDGDGLVDCDDPSCSGVESCPIIDPSSGGDGGGLESNNRLSEKISKRNYDRLKKGYVFNPQLARRIKKTQNYALKNSNFTLESFVPINIINEDEVIESTPKDLINITNAEDIISVDYLRDKKIIATVMVLKSKDGVYEHTKPICDRLLGAELLSVSTIQLRGENFIRSIIKNVEGNIEFVLSFSARELTNSTKFLIENHWNLDKYKEGEDFYNFQIWSNSLDDLLKLSSEVLDLLENQKEIDSYIISPPPPVFVKKGKYTNGKLELEIINANKTENVAFDAGYKITETSNVYSMSSVLNLENYSTKVNIETGQLFDIGFRIGDGIQTPDDVFMSDGPWGVDDYASTTRIKNFDVSNNIYSVNTDELRIERNIKLESETEEFVSVYKALTPRFKAVDISNFGSISFIASGTGKVDVRLVKKGITEWENQFKHQINLTNTPQEFTINFDNFISKTNNTPVFNDVVTLVFTMEAYGVKQQKNIKIDDIKLGSKQITLATSTIEKDKNRILYYNKSLHFNSEYYENGELLIYSLSGRLIFSDKLTLKQGINKYSLTKTKLSTGIYLVKLKGIKSYYNIEKVLITK